MTDLRYFLYTEDPRTDSFVEPECSPDNTGSDKRENSKAIKFFLWGSIPDESQQ